VDVHELHAGHCSGRENGSGDCVWNVVEFEVEKNARAKRCDFLDGGGASGGEELAAYLEHADQIGDLAGKFDCGGKGIEIECDDQAAAWMGVERYGTHGVIVSATPAGFGVSALPAVASVPTGPD